MSGIVCVRLYACVRAYVRVTVHVWVYMCL
jgi:hypothetical protein